MSFEERLYESLNYADDPFDMATVCEAAGTLLGEVAVNVSNVMDIGEATDVLEVTRTEEGVNVKAILNVPYEKWTDNTRIVTFSLLHDGFAYIANDRAFVCEVDIP